MFETIKELNIVCVSHNNALCQWCEQHKRDYTFLQPPNIFFDPSFLPVEVHEKIPQHHTKICLLHLELWTLSAVYDIVSKIHPDQLIGVGFDTSIGNRLGYNLFHFYKSPPILPKIIIGQELSFEQLDTVSSKCACVKVGSNVFHLDIMEGISKLIKKFANKRITLTTNVLISQVPYEFVSGLQQE